MSRFIPRLKPVGFHAPVLLCKRNDAIAHLQALNRLNAGAVYEIIFDPGY
ncbi:hypothetical protein ACQ4M3_12670 [Leptolyngbya sp. AN03gr2]